MPERGRGRRKNCGFWLVSVAVLAGCGPMAWAQLQPTVTTVAVPQRVGNLGDAISMTGLMNTSGGIFPGGTLQFTDGTTVLSTQTVASSSTTNYLPSSTPSALWTISGVANVVSGSAVAPDGTSTASTLEFDGSSNVSISLQASSLDPHPKYLFSVWMKTEGTAFTTAIAVSGPDAIQVAKTVRVTNTWQRFSVLGSLGYQDSTATVTIGGNGSLGPSRTAGALQIWGAQLEKVGPGPFQATTGQSVASAATNLVPYSISVDQWDTDHGDVDSRSPSDFQYMPDVDPNGTYQTSEGIYDGTSSSYFQINTGPPFGNPNYVFSVWLRVAAQNPEIDTHLVYLDQDSVFATTPIHISHTWTRFSFAQNVTGRSELSVGIGDASSFGPGIAPGAIEIWGAQLEQGTTVAGPYVETDGAPKTAAVKNLLPNTGSLSAWTASGLGSLTASPDPDPLGTATAILTPYSAVQTGALVQPVAGADPTQPYTFSVWLRVPSGTLSTYIGLYDQNGSEVSAPVGLTTDWRRFNVTGTLPLGASAVQVGIGTPAGLANCPPGANPNAAFEIWGPQLEAVAPGMYVATSGGPATASVGTASFSTSSLAVGTHEISAAYSGDTYSSPSTAVPVQVTILGGSSPVTQDMSLVCLPPVIIIGQGFNCVAQLPQGTSGNVAFQVDGQAWTASAVSADGSATANQTASGLSAGMHQVTAQYGGSLGSLTETAPVVVVAAGQTSGSLVYQYILGQGSGSNSSSSSLSGYDASGNIIAYTDSVNGSWVAGYDNLNRLVSATGVQPFGVPLVMGWTYDSFGNRLTQTGDPYSRQATYDAGNHITATQAGNVVQYDAAGDVIDDGAYHYTYDGQGRLCATQPYIAGPGVVTGYLYDAAGDRIAKGTLTVPSGSAVACPTAFAAGNFQITTMYVGGPDGETVAEADSTGTVQRSYVSGDKGVLASQDANGTHFHLADWLGTRRIQTDSNGLVEARFRNLPYGDGASQDGSDAASQHFTGKETDQESGLSFFGARYYSSAAGRFLTPD